MRQIVIAIAFVVMTAGAASAQNSRYSTWSNPDGSSGTGDAKTAEFADKLNMLVDEAEKARAADPMFLRDLRALANSYKNPWTKRILDDSFTDGNFTQNPAWEVKSGDYFIETGWGLRNRLLAQQQPRQSTPSGDDLAKVLLGQVLKRAAGLPDGSLASVAENVIVTRASIANAFSISVEFSSWVQECHFEIGVFQGQDAEIGYRLLYVSGKGLQLHRVGSRGSAVVATSNTALTLEDKEFHLLEWQRTLGGGITVFMDGEQVMSVADRSFSDPFDGLRFSDRGGDFIIKRVTVNGA